MTSHLSQICSHVIVTVLSSIIYRQTYAFLSHTHTHKKKKKFKQMFEHE